MKVRKNRKQNNTLKGASYRKKNKKIEIYKRNKSVRKCSEKNHKTKETENREIKRR